MFSPVADIRTSRKPAMSPPDGSSAERVRRGIFDEAKNVTPERSAPEPWPVMDPAAYYGLPGDIVRAIEPHSEADPVAILAQFLTACGNSVARGPYYQVEGDRHAANLYGVLVGETAKGRKGTSWGRVRQIMEFADPEWTLDRVHSGLSSGEGLIWAVRDPTRGMVPSGKGKDRQMVEEIIDHGVPDKRLMVLEPEFAGALAVMERQGNILSRIIRDAWDRGSLATLTKNSPARATGAHLSIFGHITADELRERLDRISMLNGYANRFLWLLVRRGRVLPFGGALDEGVLRALGERVATAINAARRVSRVSMTKAAREDWVLVYPTLSEGRPGLLGAILARAEAQVVRLAMLYALLDGRPDIDIEHLRAALAVWEFVESSARYIWGDTLGDPIADESLRALRQAGDDGMSRTDIRDLFGRHRGADQIGRALGVLAERGLARRVMRSSTGGRPGEIWYATRGAG
jgi:hypothetical protein